MIGPLGSHFFVVAQAIHHGGVLGEDDGCRRSLHGDIVRSHDVKVVHKKES